MGRAKPMQLPNERNYQYTEWKPTDTADIQAARATPATPTTIDPTLGLQYQRALERSNQRWGSGYGDNLPLEARQALQARENRNLRQDYGALTAQNKYDADQANFARRMALAELTLGRPLTSDVTGFDSAKTESIWKDIIRSGAQVAGAAAAAGV